MGHHPREEVKRLNSGDLNRGPLLGLKNSKKSHTELPYSLDHPISTTNEDNPRGTLFKERRKKEKVVITGDDILIEYVRRLKNVVTKTNSCVLPNSIMYYLEKFLYHKVWSLNEANKTAH